MRLARAVVVGALVACSANTETVRIGWPQSEGARSAVVAMTAESRTSIWAFDIVEPRYLRPEVAWDEDATSEVQLLLYDEDLDELGLTEGLLIPDASGSPIPKPASAFVTAVTDKEPEAWREITELSSALQAVKIPRNPQSLCTRFEVENKFGLGSGSDLAFALSLGPDAALIGMFERRMFRVDLQGVEEITDFPADLPFGAALRDELGRIWFAGDRGELWRGTVATEPTIRVEAVRVAATSTTSTIRWMAGRAAPDVEIYTLGETGSLEVFDGTAFRVLHQFREGLGTKGGVASLEPGVVYAAMATSPQVVRVVGSLVDDVTPAFNTFGVTTLIELEGQGVYFSAGQGRIFRLNDSSGWDELTESSLQLDVYTLARFDDGFVMGGAFGFVAQYRPSTTTFCAAEQLGSGSVRSVLRLGDRILLAEDKPLSRPEASVTILERIDPR